MIIWYVHFPDSIMLGTRSKLPFCASTTRLTSSFQLSVRCVVRCSVSCLI